MLGFSFSSPAPALHLGTMLWSVEHENIDLDEGQRYSNSWFHWMLQFCFLSPFAVLSLIINYCHFLCSALYFSLDFQFNATLIKPFTVEQFRRKKNLSNFIILLIDDSDKQATHKWVGNVMKLTSEIKTRITITWVNKPYRCSDSAHW